MRQKKKSKCFAHPPEDEEKKQRCCCCKIRGKVHMRKTILLLLDKENLKGAHEKKSVPLQDEESSVPSSSTEVQHKII
jgi:hypothetical protein